MVKDVNRKIKSRTEISKLASELKDAGRKIVTINGSFDLLHAGHLDILRQAAEQGDVLIVGLNSDASVKESKGLGRPIISERYRAEALASLEFVDYVTIFGERESLKFVESVLPNVHVNGGDYGRDCIERKLVKKHGGRVHIVERKIPVSTSDIIERIKNEKNN